MAKAGPPASRECITVLDAVRIAGELHAGRDAYVDGADRMTFGQWLQRSAAVAVDLAARGVAAGDVVALMLDSGIDYAVAYLAVVRLGAVVTGLNPRLGRAETDAIMARCTPALVIRDDRLAMPDVPAGIPIMRRAELTAAAMTHRPRFDEHRPRPDSPAVIIWTSGTTGQPKGAWFDHAGLAAAVAAAGVLARSAERRLVGTPFAHAGYMAKVFEQLVYGTTMVLCPRPWRASDMLRSLVEQRINVAAAVPTQWYKLLEELAAEPRLGPLPDLRIAVSATAAAPPELVREVRARLGCPLVVRYAMTESPSITGTDPDDPPDVQSHTVGRPQAGVQVRIGSTNPVPGPGSPGEVRVRGRCVMRGYWGDAELTAAAFEDGWLRTGDLGYLDESGNLVLVGRAKDMYIRGGYNVYPLEVEDVIATRVEVAQVAIVPVAAPVIGEIGVAFVVRAPRHAPPTLAEIRAHVAAHLADYKAPDRLVVLDALPLTAMLKVDKAALRRMVEPA